MTSTPQNGPRIMSPAQAGEVLGLSKRRVAQLLEAGELAGRKNPDTGFWEIPAPHVYALLDERKQKPTPGPGPTPQADRELIETLKAQVADLRDRLDRQEEANRENRRIIAALTARIPELPATQEHSSSPEATREPTEATAPRSREGHRTIRTLRRALSARGGGVCLGVSTAHGGVECSEGDADGSVLPR
jgi:hypothetical protein